MTDKATGTVAALLEKDEAYFSEQSKEELVSSLLQLTEYVKLTSSQPDTSSTLWGNKRNANEANAVSPVVDVDGSVQSLRKIIPKQIKAQMIWKPTCKTGKATWKYEGVCASAAVFHALMKSNVNFKRKKISTSELFDILECGSLMKSIRYCHLLMTGDVTVTWSDNTREFKFSGTYGKF